jgi:hypothetical protein
MKALVVILGVLMVYVGAVWTLQGLNVLPGSFMSGDIQWTVYGLLLAAAGLGLVVWSRRRRA